ncbi:MAG: ribonuclease P protein component [Gammaproteobacteria bacterium]
MDRRARCFGKETRLSRPKDYQRVFESACRSVDGCLIVLARENGLDHARLGFAISRSHIKTAVNRNCIKRLVRESFRNHQAELRGLDIVVIARKSTAGFTKQSLLSSLSHHWQRLVPCKDS